MVAQFEGDGHAKPPEREATDFARDFNVLFRGFAPSREIDVPWPIEAIPLSGPLPRGKERPAVTPATTAAIPKTLPPINLMKWVEENRHLMKPPVSNKYLYDGEDFFIMLINGPNARNDFHQTNSEEFFLQLKGDI